MRLGAREGNAASPSVQSKRSCGGPPPGRFDSLIYGQHDRWPKRRSKEKAPAIARASPGWSNGWSDLPGACSSSRGCFLRPAAQQSGALAVTAGAGSPRPPAPLRTGLPTLRVRAATPAGEASTCRPLRCHERMFAHPLFAQALRESREPTPASGQAIDRMRARGLRSGGRRETSTHG